MKWRPGSGVRGLVVVAMAVTGLISLAGCGSYGVDMDTVSHLDVRFTRADSLVASAVADGLVPGAVLLVARNGEVVHERAFGHARLYRADAVGPGEADSPGVARVPQPEPMTVDHVFDLASVTKVMATTFAMMLLVDRGLVDLDAPVSAYLPGFRGGGKDAVRVRDLLTHRAGLLQWVPVYYHATTPRDAYRYIRSLPLAFPVGERRYSDLGFMLLGYLVERVTGDPLDRLLERELYGPLGLRHTGFNPRAAGPSSSGPPARGPFAATSHGNPFERRMVADDDFGYTVDEDPAAFVGWRRYTLVGEVNDGNAWYAHGGVAGHAGLFSTARELAVLLDLLLAGARSGGIGDGVGARAGAGPGVTGEGAGRRFLEPETIRAFLQPGGATDPVEPALGWVVETADDGAVASFSHTGFTGTYVHAVPRQGLAIVLLTNRQQGGVNDLGTYPDVNPLRRAVVEALTGGEPAG